MKKLNLKETKKLHKKMWLIIADMDVSLFEVSTNMHNIKQKALDMIGVSCYPRCLCYMCDMFMTEDCIGCPFTKINRSIDGNPCCISEDSAYLKMQNNCPQEEWTKHAIEIANMWD